MMPKQILLQDFLAQCKDKTITGEETGARARIINADYKITETRLKQFDLKISLAVLVYDKVGELLDRGYNLTLTKRNLQFIKDLNDEIEAISDPLKHEIMSGIRVRACEIANLAQR